MILDEIRQTASGARVLSEWLGDGGIPVPHEVAERRSITCLCCSENQQGNWWTWIKTKIANAIREHLEVKNKLQLRVEHEDELGTCRVCKCCLPLKVHVPMEHILPNMTEERFNALPSHCWIKEKK